MIDLLNAYQGIIFDMDGTLVDSMPAHIEAWRRTAEIHGFPFDEKWQYSLGGVPTAKIAERINAKYGLQLDCQEVAATKRQQWALLDTSPHLIDETYQVFKSLLGKRKIAVGTGSIRSHAEHVLTDVGVIEHLDALVTACDVSEGKPHPETFVTAAESMGVAPEHCVVFEDTDIGEQAARAAGMDCIRIDFGVIRWPASSS
ncbi:beta-phosphoglucomutase family hydrolase [Neiella sp. HB171785]|uniref:Beta-phosphoglucomutase family hydrolase n=1 Tax=Neiella litorisoli TaxID=2771431 RepID=A0A8J6QF14_9GAMM|nr:beta-phosphoglucomutase family hydrolase [Neiella litorisoli]MBD1388025.1 beta-phosphoglucomutase family hydrolase [Neiella litorisoli]